MKKFALSVIIFALLAAGSLSLSLYAKNSIQAILKASCEISEEKGEFDKKENRKLIEHLTQVWEKKKLGLRLFIKKNELDLADMELVGVECAVMSGDYNEYLLCLRRFREEIRDIEEMSTFGFFQII